MAIADDVRAELADLGLRSVGEAVGRVDLLVAPERGALALDDVVSGPRWAPEASIAGVAPKDRALYDGRPATTGFEADAVDELLARVEAGRRVIVRARVTPRDRSVGARLSGALSRRPEPRQLPHVRYELTGSAGQSLGAFAVAGMRITVTGEANDYVGKGLSGATLVVRPPEAAAGGQDQALAGNVCLFGATGGVLHVVGRAGMRFGVRNSGARAVVEGIGAHGCEYMTGGTVVVLGEVGPNFGAGMTGGRAFLLDAAELRGRLNAESVDARAPEEADLRVLRELLAAHSAEGSRRATDLLRDWRPERFLVVEPRTATAAAVSVDELVAAAR
jgi:glutamate synthase (NADPH/NADH) large chain